ncbi:hypothetical protein G6F46_001526 [Rhizopus delemar]|uniref:Uncharacterized protein n=3 Tax=Rhizopus TaxID=4842 RepID=I1CQ55_RHIO9|nr:hypothetical protein RO3G_15296 [Rhizopus delemar RA 99-880]KAG1457574.1 hypothetical protein G6F55_005850 [Rhizopus delemar]KAG1551859.1 hypothetical protein G6F51_001590 [Rhizopus arrhizus]KAG1496296.1 hypothetical protein G6F54_006570 [Rhizopus delemar]KAG1517615.1 hypothetical protein G6F53_001240 [Rhizopus delemar]|eukprot:EIE90585.1 hypothetical protein RO3G_15296 [Rhizopus delemar RA 99-880]
MNEDSQPSTPAGTMNTAGTLTSGDRILSVESSIDEFFSEAWLSLIRYRRGPVGEATARRRTFIGQYTQRYLDHNTYERSKLKYTQQSSSQEERVDNEAISNRIYEQFTLPARQFKGILASKINVLSSTELPFQVSIYNQALQRLTPILASCPVRYTSKQNNAYFDVKANPCEHIMTFYQIT